MNPIKSTFVVFTLLFSVSLQTVNAQNSITQIESIYIFNFIKNIRWSNVNDKYIVGIYSDEQTYNEFKSVLSSRNFNGKSIEVKLLGKVEQASECHIVFVDETNGSLVKKIVAGPGMKNTLIVSEKGQLDNGAGIAFVLDNSKLHFKINQDAFKTSGLQISASLLSLGV